MTLSTVTDRDAADLRSALASAVHGTVLTPSEPGYLDACALHNGAVENRPAAIVRVASAADVQATLRLARDRGLPVSVRGGGHGLDGAATSGTVVIDMRALCGVAVDPVRRTVVVRGGAIWAELDEATGAHGFAVPGARVGSVGVAGSLLAGCTGWLSARHGATDKSLLAAEWVTADGLDKGAVVDGDGIITPAAIASMTFALHAQPPVVLAGCVLYRLADGPEVAAAIADLTAQGRPEFAPLLRWQVAPPASFVRGDVVGRPVLTVLPVWIGDPDEGREFLAPLRRATRPLTDSTATMPYAALQRVLDGASRWGRRRAEFAAGQTGRVADVAARLEAALTDRPGPFGFVDLEPAHSPQWSLRAEAQWLDPAEDARQHAWLADLATEFRTARAQPDQQKEVDR
jgi:FAD/FMN-containing dehydrogenase